MKDTERRSHSMDKKHWAAIDAIAEQLQANATTGSRVGLPSWRSLLYQIATGKLVVIPSDDLGRAVSFVAQAVKALNRLEVTPRSASSKRVSLARLRHSLAALRAAQSGFVTYADPEKES